MPRSLRQTHRSTRTSDSFAAANRLPLAAALSAPPAVAAPAPSADTPHAASPSPPAFRLRHRGSHESLLGPASEPVHGTPPASSPDGPGTPRTRSKDRSLRQTP